MAEKTGAFSILWGTGTQKDKTKIYVNPGRLIDLNMSAGGLRADASVFGVNTDAAPGSTIVSVISEVNPFSFYLRDVDPEFPVYIPGFQVIVTTPGDARSYAEIEKNILARTSSTEMKRFEDEAEETYAAAAKRGYDVYSQTILGTGGDIRTFAVSPVDKGRYSGDLIRPRLHSSRLFLPETDYKPVSYNLKLGRGDGSELKCWRRLENGYIPILKSSLADGDIVYSKTAFATYADHGMSDRTKAGTHYDHYVKYIGGSKDKKELAHRIEDYFANHEDKDDVVLVIRVEALNTSGAPGYAIVSSPFPTVPPLDEVNYLDFWPEFNIPDDDYDKAKGFGKLNSGKVFCVSKMNGRPMKARDTVILLKPGCKASFDFIIPHTPVSEARALELARMDLARHYEECRDFWIKRINRAARFELPEKRVNEMVRAGLGHLMMTNYGKDSEGSINATIGLMYSSAGTESAGIIMFLDSMGWLGDARRCIEYFYDNQDEDGGMSGIYSPATVGAALYLAGEHFRYTQDNEWLKVLLSKFIKSYEYIVDWRRRNKRDELKGRGYGMPDGGVADPVDPYHYFMLSAYLFAGLNRISEALASLDPDMSRKMAKEASEIKHDIRESFYASMARTPVIPLKDGTWRPAAPPWPENRSLQGFDPAAINAMVGENKTIEAHVIPFLIDTLIGPLWLAALEVLNVSEKAVDFILNYQADMLFHNNVAFNQPYYSPHPRIHLVRGEVKAFLKAYYNHFPGHCDRQTYTFWECFGAGASAHKTHEEGWFLMQTRWMLYLEDGVSLKIFPGIPKKWLSAGKRINIKRAASYFGLLDFRAETDKAGSRITAGLSCEPGRLPETVTIRLPHPAGKKAVSCIGGEYLADAETVKIIHFTGTADIILEF